MQSVYNLNTAETDYIFNTRKIHTKFCYGTSYIILKVDTNKPDIKNLAAGIIPTGNSQLDDILNAYGFAEVDLEYGYPDFNWLGIITPQKLNLIPVVSKLKTISSFSIVETGAGCFDGNDITITTTNGQANINFSEGGGDCPSGCTYRKTWKFSVSNGIAKYIGYE